MSSSQSNQTLRDDITPPQTFVDAPLTPLLTDKSCAQVHRVIPLFAALQAERQKSQETWREFHLEPEVYYEIERQSRHDVSLSGYVKDKIQCVRPVLGRDNKKQR